MNDRDADAVALQLCPFSAQLEEGLSQLFEVVRWHALSAAEQMKFLDQRAGEVVAVVTGGHIGCPARLMAALPNLGIISINGVGFDKVDLDDAKARGIRVTTTPDVLTADVADLAVGLTIDLLRGIGTSDRFLRAGKWQTGERPLGVRVTGKRFGIVGLGRIGRAAADRLAVFGPVRYYGPRPKEAPFPYEAKLVDLADWADVLVVACSANAASRHLVDAPVLAALGGDGFLVNVSRGLVVDEQALIEALEDRVIRGAALDVFADEPRVPDALVQSERTVLTPHIASATEECRREMAEMVLGNLRAFLSAQPLLTAVA